MPLKNVQIIDGADNATFSIFQATDEEFEAIFPAPGQDIEFIEDFVARAGDKKAGMILTPLWKRPIRKTDAMGIHGTLFYQWEDRKQYLPKTKREIDTPTLAINNEQRKLFISLGSNPMPWKP